MRVGDTLYYSLLIARQTLLKVRKTRINAALANGDPSFSL